MNTWYLDPATWDITFDSTGRIRTVLDVRSSDADVYALAQDSGSEIRTFKGEVYYDRTQGIPYWDTVLGKFPPVSLLKACFNQAAMRTPEVVNAVSFLRAIQHRSLSGQVQVRNALGQVQAANFFAYSPEVIAIEGP